MNDQLRSAYLDAIGIDRYVSRYQLTGAAVTPRFSVVATAQPTLEAIEPAPPESVIPPDRPVDLAPAQARVNAQAEQLPGIPGAPSYVPEPVAAGAPRFSIAAIVAGQWLWVEELAGNPLAREQVQLVQAMACALQRAEQDGSTVEVAPRPQVAQFDWPMHNNRQLDLGVAAANAALASFLARRLEQDGLALVLLGRAAAERVPRSELACPQLVLRHSSAELLARPELKKQAWTDLRSSPGRN